MELSLHSFRRSFGFGARRGAVAVCLLLLAPLCSAVCGGHPPAFVDVVADVVADDAPAMDMAAHGDCHGVMAVTTDDDGDAGPADEQASSCCDDTGALLPTERALALPDPVAIFTGALTDLLPRSEHLALPRPAPLPGGRSPGRTILLLILSFLE